MSKFTITLFLLLTIVTYSFAQKSQTSDYIVTHQGDTLSGKVKFKSISLLHFKSEKLDEATIFTSDEIKAVYADGKSYTVENVSGQNKFLQEVVTGYLSLYRFKRAGSEEDFFFMRNDTVFVVSETNFLGLSAMFLKECQNNTDLTADQIRKQYKLSLKGLTKFVSYYNACKGYKDEQVIKYSPEKLHYTPVLNIGVDAHQFKFGNRGAYHPGVSFETEFGFVAGVSMKFGKEIGLSIRPGIQFTHRKAAGHFRLSETGSASEDIDISASYVEINAMARYGFAGNNIRPFLSFGPHFGLGFNQPIERTTYGFSYAQEDGTNRATKYGFSGGAGLLFPHILKGLEIELRADQGYYTDGFDATDLQSTSIGVIFGFYL